ncbi:cytochrome P450 [Xylariaceae sp. FL0594]|nr:cytochrome P450 [Xylariaceae sp. FL0594]
MSSTTLPMVLGPPDLAQLLLGTGFLALLLYAISSVVAWRKLRHIPGPFVASFSYAWLTWAVATGKSDLIVDAEQRRRGKVTRVGPNAVSVYDPDALTRINGVRAAYTRGPWYSSFRFDSRGHSIITLLDPAIHSKRKAKLNSGFSAKNMANLERSVDKWTEALVLSIRRKITAAGVAGSGVIDMSLLIQYFQLDLISEAEMGQPWGYLEHETDSIEYLKMSDTLMPYIHILCTHPLGRALYEAKWFMNLIGPKTSDKTGLGVFLRKIEKEVTERFQDEEKRKERKNDILGQWMSHGLGPDECQYDLAFVLPAGAETIVTTIRGTLLHLTSSPAIYQRAKDEIRTAIRSGSVSDPVTNEEAKGLQYIQAVVHEGLRLMVPLTFGFPKRVPPGGDTLCGVYLPGGTDVYTNFRGLMRNPDIFGQDVDVFRPERFLGVEGDVSRMLKTVDLAFGYGSTMCLGKSLAQMEMNKIFVELLRHFDFQIVNSQKPWKQRCYTTYLIHDFLVRVTEDRME